MDASHASTNIILRIGIIVLTLGTAFTHMSLNFPDPVFILNGLGYLTLLAALYLPIPALRPYRRLIRLVFIGYTALTIFLWVLFGYRATIGYVNKINEVALIILLLLEGRQEGDF